MRPLTTFLTTACMSASVHAATPPPAISVTSSAFSANGEIPSEHTCDGAQLSPPLAWSPPPTGTKSIAILVDDPDAPRGTFTHWIITGLPPTTTSLPAGAKLPAGAVAGKNDFGAAGWGGPCPPSGRHRYVFHVYALDIPLAKSLSPAAFKSAIAGHILAEGELIGTYQRT